MRSIGKFHKNATPGYFYKMFTQHFSLLAILLYLTLSPRIAMPAEIVINEVMADPFLESTVEFVELYNAGVDSADLSGWILGDLKDHNDVLIDYTDTFDSGAAGTVIYPGQYALIVDPGYTGTYNHIIEAYTDQNKFIMLTIQGDQTLGNGLGNSGDAIYLEFNGRRMDTFIWQRAAGGNGISWE